MFGVERRNGIITLLNEKKSITVQETAEMYGVTEETIRRDLKFLESQGLLMRTHGGAVLAEDLKEEASVEIRQGINISGKDAIGKEAARLVNDGDTIILDASTSSLFAAKHIKGLSGITVITNAEKVVLELFDCDNITVICTGGILRRKSLSYVGHSAEAALSNYHANKAFLSCKGFSPDSGFTDSNEQESGIRKLMIKCSKKVIYLCDHTKFDKLGFITTATLDDIDYFITDTSISEDWKNSINNAEITFKIAGR